MNNSLNIQPFRPGDEPAILELFQQSFGCQLPEKVWAWRFRDNPSGQGLIELCWDGDVLAAHYAVTAVVSRIAGQDYIIGLSGTTMTQSNYRGRGLFQILARKIYKRMAESGMAMVWGFPNAISHRGFVKDLGWTDIYEIPMFRLALTSRSSLPSPGNETIEIQQFDLRFDKLWERVKDNSLIATKRDHKHLHWRYIKNPAESYRVLAYIDGDDLLGYVVLKRYKDEIHIVDLLTVQDEEIGIHLISKAVQFGLRDSATIVSLWLNVTHPLHHALERFGFNNGEPVTYFGALLLQPGLQESYIYDFRRWFMTMGDSDVF